MKIVVLILLFAAIIDALELSYFSEKGALLINNKPILADGLDNEHVGDMYARLAGYEPILSTDMVCL